MFLEQVDSKQKTKTKECLIEELKNENESLRAEIKTKKTEYEALQLANEKLKQNSDKGEQTDNNSTLNQELDNEKLINLTGDIDKPAEQLTQKLIMTTTLLQATTDKLVTERNPSKMFLVVTCQNKILTKEDENRLRVHGKLFVVVISVLVTSLMVALKAPLISFT